MTDRCSAFTRSGDRCKNAAASDRKYCAVHDERYSIISSFIKENKKDIRGFLLGVLTETIIDDGWDVLKNVFTRKGHGSTDRSTVQEVLDLVGKALPTCVAGGRHFRVEFFPASRSAPFSVFECHLLKNPDDGTPADPPRIGVFYNDAEGRRFIGEIRGVSVWTDFTSDPPCLYTLADEVGENKQMNCYELRGSDGEEWLALTKEFYVIHGGSLDGSGSLGAISWRNPPRSEPDQERGPVSRRGLFGLEKL